MRIGSRSLLFGAHQLFIHPLFVLWAWWTLYGFPWDPRVWLSCLVHDWGYWGRPNLDGEEGERHVELGARIMSIFGPSWRGLCLYHSRSYATAHNQPISRLCVADKLALCITPSWLYLPLARLSGEIKEYKELALTGKYKDYKVGGLPDKEWFKGVRANNLRFVLENWRWKPSCNS